MPGKTNRSKIAGMSGRQVAIVGGLAVLVGLILVICLLLLIDNPVNTLLTQTSLIASTRTPMVTLPTRPTFPPTWTPTSMAKPTAKSAPTVTPESILPTLPAATSSTSCVVGTWHFEDLAAHLLTVISGFDHFGFKLVDSQGDVFVTFSADGRVDVQANQFSAKMATQQIANRFFMDGRATAGYTIDGTGQVTLTDIDLKHLRFTETRFFDEPVLATADDLTNRLAAAAAGVEPPITVRPFSATIDLECSDRTLQYAPGIQPMQLTRLGSLDTTAADNCLVGTWEYKDVASSVLLNTRYFDGVTHIADNQGRLTFAFSPNGQVTIKADRAVATLGLVDKPSRGNRDLVFSFNGRVTANYSLTGTQTVVLSKVNSRGLTFEALSMRPDTADPSTAARIFNEGVMLPFLSLAPVPGQSNITAMYRCNGDTLEYLPAWPLTLSRTDPH